MQNRIYFTREEAEAEIGHEVEALAPFPSVPRGTKGEVVKAAHYALDRFVVEVRWRLPRPNELIDLTVAEYSFNFMKRRKAVADEFCKSEYAELVRVLQHAVDP